MRKRKPRYHASWGWSEIKTFTGTKRGIINRLKRASFVDMVDTLHVFECDTEKNVLWDNILHSPDADDFFTTEEWAEVTGVVHQSLKQFYKSEFARLATNKKKALALKAEVAHQVSAEWAEEMYRKYTQYEIVGPVSVLGIRQAYLIAQEDEYVDGVPSFHSLRTAHKAIEQLLAGVFVRQFATKWAAETYAQQAGGIVRYDESLMMSCVHPV